MVWTVDCKSNEAGSIPVYPSKIMKKIKEILSEYFHTIVSVIAILLIIGMITYGYYDSQKHIGFHSHTGE